MAWLKFEVESRDSSYSERVRFAGKSLTIGRNEECDVTLGYSTVSGVHARIVRSGRRFRVEDASSRNGILLNRIPVGTAEVHAGDVLTLGPRGPAVKLIGLNAGPAILPRVLVSFIVLLLTAGGVLALRQNAVEEWLLQARLWLPQYEGAKWFAAEAPGSVPDAEPEEIPEPKQPDGGPTGREDPGTRQFPDPPTHFGDDRAPVHRPPPPGLHTPLVGGTTALSGPRDGTAREALAETIIEPPDLAAPSPKLSSRYLFIGVRKGVATGKVNDTLARAKAKIRASFPRQNVLLAEVPENGLALGILRDSGYFGLLLAATEGAPGALDAETQAQALVMLVNSLDPPAFWDHDGLFDAGRDDTTISRFPPGGTIRDLDIQNPRLAARGNQVLVIYELEHTRESGTDRVRFEQTRALILDRSGGILGPVQDVTIADLPEALRSAAEPILRLSESGGK